MKILVTILLLISQNSVIQQNFNIDNYEAEEQLQMTVVLKMEHPIYEWKIDTLVKDSIITKNTATIDVYFCRKLIRLPYYLPTNGLFREALKDNECDMSIYPKNVRCYEYDHKGRVSKMSIEGSGTTGYYTYQYDALDRVKKMKRFLTTYKFKYLERTQLLTEFIVDGSGKQKRLIIAYR